MLQGALVNGGYDFSLSFMEIYIFYCEKNYVSIVRRLKEVCELGEWWGDRKYGWEATSGFPCRKVEGKF